MTDQTGSVLPFPPAGITAAEHLADAQLHLRRCLLAIKSAATVAPHLVTRLGTPHCQLQDVLADLERVRHD